jgi:ketosteroid isomerase-like protein
MKSLTALLALCLSVPLSALGAQSEEQRVMTVSQEACDAFRNRDAAKLENLLSEDFTRINTNSQMQSRQENLDEMKKGDPVFEVFKNEEMKARVYGDAAVVQGVTHFKGTYSGQAFDLRARFTDTLVRENGDWKIIATHVTKVPERDSGGANRK